MRPDLVPQLLEGRVETVGAFVEESLRGPVDQNAKRIGVDDRIGLGGAPVDRLAVEHVELAREIGTHRLRQAHAVAAVVGEGGRDQRQLYASRPEMISQQVGRAFETTACDHHRVRLEVSLSRRIAYVHAGHPAVAAGAQRHRFGLIVDPRIGKCVEAVRQLVYERHAAAGRHAQAPSRVAVGERLLEVNPGHRVSIQEVERRGDLAREHMAILEIRLAS